MSIFISCSPPDEPLPVHCGSIHNVSRRFVPLFGLKIDLCYFFSQIFCHVQKDCPLTMITCPYAEMGCTSKVMGHFQEWHLFCTSEAYATRTISVCGVPLTY